ncbi:DNA primase [Babesia gibsoni]|uniref:DNA primase n=1 Tax=Babesia gibsoni TaxID=33632 RepID=A0AAD8PE97_BABGI|nr:DNA primase [Babesia gibsoni]
MVKYTDGSSHKRKAYQDDAVVTEANLRFYYDKLYPVRDLVRWISYEGEKVSGLLPRRELSFTFQKEAGGTTNEMYARWQSFDTQAQLQGMLSGRDAVPYKLDIGAIYNKPVSIMQLSGNQFKAVERELVFDIDMNDYDDLRTCCTEKRICHKCWRYISIAADVLTASLTEDFGYKNILWVYSGRRGIHCWVCDSKARSLPSEARGAMVDYLTLVSPGDGHKKRVSLFQCEGHALVLRSFDICYRNFYDLLRDQNFLVSQEHLETAMDYITEKYSGAHEILKRASKKGVTDSVRLFNELCDCLEVSNPEEYRNSKQEFPLRTQAFPVAFREMVFAFSYPRLDAAVSKDIGHLLKAPFCIHAKTGRVCVPLEPEKISAFQPEEVPTLMALRDYYESNGGGNNMFYVIANTGDMTNSPLSGYLRFFRERFVHNVTINGARGDSCDAT